MNAHTKQRTGEFNMPAMLKDGVGIDELLYVPYVFVRVDRSDGCVWVGHVYLII